MKHETIFRPLWIFFAPNKILFPKSSSTAKDLDMVIICSIHEPFLFISVWQVYNELNAKNDTILRNVLDIEACKYIHFRKRSNVLSLHCTVCLKRTCYFQINISKAKSTSLSFIYSLLAQKWIQKSIYIWLSHIICVFFCLFFDCLIIPYLLSFSCFFSFLFLTTD